MLYLGKRKGGVMLEIFFVVHLLIHYEYIPEWLTVSIGMYILHYVRFEVFTAVTMKNGVFWGVTPCGSCKNRRFGGT
jgi:hypothetical protein